MSESLSKFFVYGLFRPGAANWSEIHKEVRQVVGDLQVPGTMYYHISYLYPVVDFNQNDSLIIGDIIAVTQTCGEWIKAIECGSGYVPKQIDVKVHDDLWYKPVAFHWPHAQHGAAIQDGDWLNSADALTQ